MAEWTSEHGQTKKVSSSNGYSVNAVHLAVGYCMYNFREFGGCLGNVGLGKEWRIDAS